MSDYPLPQRLSYPEAESVHPWLAALLDAYHEIDLGVQEAVRREQRQGRVLQDLGWSRLADRMGEWSTTPARP